jgi:hypothetical protein
MLLKTEKDVNAFREKLQEELSIVSNKLYRDERIGRRRLRA